MVGLTEYISIITICWCNFHNYHCPLWGKYFEKTLKCGPRYLFCLPLNVEKQIQSPCLVCVICHTPITEILNNKISQGLSRKKLAIFEGYPSQYEKFMSRPTDYEGISIYTLGGGRFTVLDSYNMHELC